jgi:hypothetical protein
MNNGLGKLTHKINNCKILENEAIVSSLKNKGETSQLIKMNQ